MHACVASGWFKTLARLLRGKKNATQLVNQLLFLASNYKLPELLLFGNLLRG
jgi:hypothetical protein